MISSVRKGDRLLYIGSQLPVDTIGIAIQDSWTSIRFKREVVDIETDNHAIYRCVPVDDLTPYKTIHDIDEPEEKLESYVEQQSVQVEPKFKVGDIVRVKYPKFCKGEIGIIDEIGSRILEYHLKGNKTLENDYFAEDMLEHYTEPETKDNMKEKELNLCELLKGCEGEVFYSLIDGEVKLKQLTDYDVICQYHKYHRKGYLSGCSLDGVVMLYPPPAPSTRNIRLTLTPLGWSG